MKTFLRALRAVGVVLALCITLARAQEAQTLPLVMTLEAQQQQQGHIQVSEQWIPACSFMADTAAALYTLLERNIPGTYHLDSNALEAHPFARIVAALSGHFGRGWTLEHTADYRHDQRLIGHETLMPPLSSRLPELGV